MPFLRSPYKLLKIVGFGFEKVVNREQVWRRQSVP